MEEGSRRTKDRRFIVELRDRAMNRTLLLHMKIESKSNAFGIRRSSGDERGSSLSLSYGRVVKFKTRPTMSKKLRFKKQP